MNSLKNKIIAMLAVLLVAGAGYVLATGATLAPRTSLAAPVLISQDTITGIYESASPAVVEIEVTQQRSGFGGRSFRDGQGSGFLVDTQGHILTNNHVVRGASSVQVTFKNGNSADAKVVATDSANDLAVIKVDRASVLGITPLQLGDSSAVKPGQIAIALGSPFGLDGSITVGVISGVNRSLRGSNLTGMLQTDAAINPGNSGGPLLDSQGQVIGINTAIEATSGARGVGFAVASSIAKKQLPDMIAGKAATRPFLGISGVGLTQSLARELGLSVNQGVYVVTVTPNGPAEKAGLKGGGAGADGGPASGGDVITAVDGKSLTSVEELAAYLNANKRVGDSVSLTVLRGTTGFNLTATLAAFPDVSAGTLPTPAPLPGIPRGRNFR